MNIFSQGGWLRASYGSGTDKMLETGIRLDSIVGAFCPVSSSYTTVNKGGSDTLLQDTFDIVFHVGHSREIRIEKIEVHGEVDRWYMERYIQEILHKHRISNALLSSSA
jgi:hypothetical protein